jgi:hypothetical protein
MIRVCGDSLFIQELRNRLGFISRQAIYYPGFSEMPAFDKLKQLPLFIIFGLHRIVDVRPVKT